MLTLPSLEPFALSNLLIATVLGKLGKLDRMVVGMLLGLTEWYRLLW